VGKTKKDKEFSRMFEMGILEPGTKIEAVFGEASGLGLSAKAGILFYAPEKGIGGFFGYGILGAKDKWRISDIFDIRIEDTCIGADRYNHVVIEVLLVDYIREADQEPQTSKRGSLKLVIFDHYIKPDGAEMLKARKQDAYDWVYKLKAIHEPFNHGLELFQEGRYKEALSSYEQALQRSPESLKLLEQAGVSAYHADDNDRARNYLLKAEEIIKVPNELVSKYLGLIFLEEGDFDRASQYAQFLLSSNKNDPEANNLIASIYLNQGNLRQADIHINRALAQNPRNIDYLANKSNILLSERRFKDAGKIVRKARRIDPTDVRITLDMAKALIEANRFEEARQYFEAAQANAPDDPYTIGTSTYFVFADGKLDVAAKKAKKVHELALPANKEFNFFIGLIGIVSKNKDLTLNAAERLQQLGKTEQESYSFGLVLKAAAGMFQGSVSDLDGVAKCLEHYEQEAEHKQAEIGEDLSSKLLRGVWAATKGRYLFHTGKDDAESSKHLNEAIFLLSEDEQVLQKGLQPYVSELESLIVKLSERVAQSHVESTPKSRTVLEGAPRPSVLESAKKYYNLLAGYRETLDQSRRMSEILSEFDQPLLVTVVGEFNVGKSTFINALIGEAIAPMDVVPTTATINYLKYGDERKIRIFFRDGRIQEREIGELERFTRETQDEERNKLLRQVDYVEILFPMETLKKLNIVDTPGLNDLIEEHQETTESFVGKSDAVIWLFRADVAGKESEREHLEFLQRNQKKTIGVVNQIDLAEDESEVDKILKSTRKGFSKYLSDLVGISARDALEAKRSGQHKLLDWSNFPQLEKLLQERFAERAREIKQAATVGKIAIVNQEVSEKQQILLKKKKDSAARIKEIRKTIDNFQERFRKRLLEEETRFEKYLKVALREMCKEAYMTFK